MTLKGEIEKLLAEHYNTHWDDEAGSWRCACKVLYNTADVDERSDARIAHHAEVIAEWMPGSQAVYEDLAECAELDARYIEFFRHFDSSGAHAAARWLRGMAVLVRQGTVLSRRWDPFREDARDVRG